MPLTEKQARKIIEEIAQEHGITFFEVRKEMEKAILEGIKSTEPQTIAFWKAVPHKGDKPTPEEFLAYMAEAGL